MKKLMVYLDEDFHESLKELAHRKKTTMAALVRYAVDLTFEDDLDVISGELALEEALRDPSSTISLDEYIKRRGLELPSDASPKGRARARQTSRPGSRPSDGGAQANGRRTPRGRRQEIVRDGPSSVAPTSG
jgi:hypothetical protein